MEKRKRWQFFLIIGVLVLTIYNILPTIFYYSNSLRSPIDETRSEAIVSSLVKRVNLLEKDAVDWLHSYCKHLTLKPQSIELDKSNPKFIRVTFSNTEEAEVLRRFLPNAGSLIPFVPAQLQVAREDNDPLVVSVERRIGIHLDSSEDKLFQFASKRDKNDQIAPLYRDLIYDRIIEAAHVIAGPSRTGLQVELALHSQLQDQSIDTLVALSKELNDIISTFGIESDLAQRYIRSFSQSSEETPSQLVHKLTSKIETASSQIDSQQKSILAEQQRLQEDGLFLDPTKEQMLDVLVRQKASLDEAGKTLRSQSSSFSAAKTPLTRVQLRELLRSVENSEVQTLDLSTYHPYIKGLVIDWDSSTLDFDLYSDVSEILFKDSQSEVEAYQRDRLKQYVINDIARISRLADEKISPTTNGFALSFDELNNSRSFLLLDLGVLAEQQAEQILSELDRSWIPQHSDLLRSSFPLWSYGEFQDLPLQEQKLGLMVYAPGMYETEAHKGFRRNSIYVVARGISDLVKQYEEFPESPESITLLQDFDSLRAILQRNGFFGYPGASFGIDEQYKNDYIFELNEYYADLVAATRENMSVHGSKRFAVLEFTDIEQRLLTENEIDKQRHEDLLKWREDFQIAQVDMNPMAKYRVPPPTKNVFVENFKLNTKKYFRGDERKVLKLGLDLAGGKSVVIGLLDQAQRPVTDPEDISQAVNELYNRVNRMGVSEVSIRSEGNNIILDFPGSQGISASELISASAMYFHIVNEQFSLKNPALAETVNQFLQQVWNEAVVTNRQTAAEVNEIAWEHLGGDPETGQVARPRNEYARTLYDNGLRIASPKKDVASNTFNDTLSSIAVLRGEDHSEWMGQNHPLMVVFHNYALEGANLSNIQVGYDPSQGNILSFSVLNSYKDKERRAESPVKDFSAWTSQFAEDKIGGTIKESYSNGNGWRMAIILNGEVVSAPTLNVALTDNASIHGNFTQREINHLAADLKAGSLSFQPQILSEVNVSPDLGREERNSGLIASGLGLFLVIAIMILYYRFAGVVASVAVLFNLLIMWGVLQNLDAALTLPGIAGIILTMGMAVDANVLVFERIREEFSISQRIGSAIQAGYRKAFTAIIDSNLTTVIAAVILIQFDSGPIKGFALTLIIGIVSSMFTALFMTRYFFAGWVQSSQNKELPMPNTLRHTSFDFLAKKTIAIACSLALIVAGMGLLYQQKQTILGMDFTGGYSLSVEMNEKEGVTSYRKMANEILFDQGLSSGDFSVHVLNRPTQLRLQFAMSMEESGYPFSGMEEEQSSEDYEYAYLANPRLAWVVKTLEEGGLSIREDQLSQLDQNWRVMSGQFSDSMRNSAIIGLLLALVAILIYITFRFEFKYGISAIIAIVHDVLISLAALAFLHKIGLNVQIDLAVVGAIMTIIGYSLNDTIIVFDRIREDARILRKMSFSEVINHAINITLSRTLMTSGTTLAVLVSLVLFGGPNIFPLAIVMLLGVIFGTFSSLFIVSPIMLYFHDREEQMQENALTT